MIHYSHRVPYVPMEIVRKTTAVPGQNMLFKYITHDALLVIKPFSMTLELKLNLDETFALHFNDPLLNNTSKKSHSTQDSCLAKNSCLKLHMSHNKQSWFIFDQHSQRNLRNSRLHCHSNLKSCNPALNRLVALDVVHLTLSKKLLCKVTVIENSWQIH